MWGLFWRKRRVEVLDTPEMSHFYQTLERMNQVQFLALRAAWQSVPHRAHEDAWTSIRAVGARYRLAREIDRVGDEARAWAMRGSSVYPYATTNTDVTWMHVRMDAGEAIVDAALAIALGSRLDPDTRDILMGPWLSATETFGEPVESA